MKQIITLLCGLIPITGFAQETTCSRIIDKAEPVDTAKFNVTYTLKYLCLSDHISSEVCPV